MSLFAMLLLVLLGSGSLMLVLHVAFRLQATDGIKIHRAKSRLASDRLRRTVATNALMSGLLVLILPQLLHPVLFRADAGAWTDIAVEIGEALILYDLLYYLMHRYPFHQWKWLQKVHTVHHAAKHPTAVESLYMHPVENLAGLLLLFFCAWLAGPVSHFSFAVLVIVYSYLNIVIHCGLHMRSWLLRPFGFMARKHDRHHQHMKAGNYASITPIPDLLFGTYE